MVADICLRPIEQGELARLMYSKIPDIERFSSLQAELIHGSHEALEIKRGASARTEAAQGPLTHGCYLTNMHAFAERICITRVCILARLRGKIA